MGGDRYHRLLNTLVVVGASLTGSSGCLRSHGPPDYQAGEIDPGGRFGGPGASGFESPAGGPLVLPPTVEGNCAWGSVLQPADHGYAEADAGGDADAGTPACPEQLQACFQSDLDRYCPCCDIPHVE